MSADKDADKDQGFLARWSRLKQDEDRARAEGQAKAANPTGRAIAKTPAEEAPAIDLSRLPKIEDLTGESDISVFLQKGVPEELRRLALRKAWTLDPNIRDFVEMAETQYDWNKPDGVPGFGPLAADVDLKALLAQAIGEWPAKARAPAEAADVLNAKAVSAVRPDGPLVAADGDASRGGNGGAAAIPASITTDRLTLPVSKRDAADPAADPADGGAPQAVRRRHGGALPRAKEA